MATESNMNIIDTKDEGIVVKEIPISISDEKLRNSLSCAYEEVRKIYSSRSSAVHGNKTKDNLESAVEESANLLTRILRRCAELNKLPDVDNLAFRVDKQKQGIKCKILVP